MLRRNEIEDHEAQNDSIVYTHTDASSHDRKQGQRDRMRLLLIEDDIRLADALADALYRRDFVVDTAGSLAEARLLLELGVYRLIILDRGLPDGDGVALMSFIGKLKPRPGVIFLTARGNSSAMIDGLSAGADDYLPKPFEVDVLIARLKAILRRPDPPFEDERLVGKLSFQNIARTASVSGEPLELPRRELAILEILMHRAGRVVAVDFLMNAVYGLGDDVQPNALQPHISRLRTKLRQAEAGVEIVGLRGIGYLLREEE